MIFSNELIISDGLHNKTKILNKINKGKVIPGMYCIALPSNDNNLMDLYRYNELLQPAMKKLDIRIIGLAANKEDAMFMVVDMLEHTYKATGGFDLVGFYKLN